VHPFPRLCPHTTYTAEGHEGKGPALLERWNICICGQAVRCPVWHVAADVQLERSQWLPALHSLNYLGTIGIPLIHAIHIFLRCITRSCVLVQCTEHACCHWLGGISNTGCRIGARMGRRYMCNDTTLGWWLGGASALQSLRAPAPHSTL
jgi:hypothetical protein